MKQTGALKAANLLTHTHTHTHMRIGAQGTEQGRERGWPVQVFWATLRGYSMRVYGSEWELHQGEGG